MYSKREDYVVSLPWTKRFPRLFAAAWRLIHLATYFSAVLRISEGLVAVYGRSLA